MARALALLCREAKPSTPRFAEHRRLGLLRPRGSGEVQAGMSWPGKVNVDAAACAGWKQWGQWGLWGRLSDTGLGAAGKMQRLLDQRPPRGMCKLAFALRRRSLPLLPSRFKGE